MCLDDLVIGQEGTRLPCGHLFHNDCGLQDWLRKSNECPVCRYELPTDDAEFERERKARTAGRKLRMRHGDLTRRSAQELRRLAAHLKVDVTGCLEKSELVDRIASASQVEIIPDEVPNSSSSAAPNADSRPLLVTSGGLEAMTSHEVRRLMGQLGMECPEEIETEKADMVKILVDSGRLVILPDKGGAEANVPQTDAASKANGHATTSAASMGDESQLKSRSVGQLRQLAKQYGISLDGCLEKGDIVERIMASPAYRP